MSILAIDNKKQNSRLRKTILVYLTISFFAAGVDKLYSVFAHGVDSAAMTWMFLYPLIAGALVFFFLKRLTPEISDWKGYRLFFNVYNSGIAMLTTAGLLKGILDIAGTGSAYVVIFNIGGWLFLAAGLVLLGLFVGVKR